jgi:anti-sigma-K factor RskA
MNVREYIESGIIELYVMNALSATERAEVATLAQQYPEIQAEIEDVEAMMQVYSQAHAITPKPELKEQILNKIKQEQTQTPEQPTTTKPQAPRPPLSILSILPYALATILGIATFYFYQQYQSVKTEKAKCEQEQNLLLLKNKNQVADLEQKLNILKSGDTKIIPLLGLPTVNKDFKATVYWNAKEKATYLTIQNLPEPNSDKQYQLWAIVDKKPVDAGVFNYSRSEIQAMKAFDHAEAFAITLEPQGGSVAPTLEKMYVLGTL